LKTSTILGIAAGLIIGFLGGYIIGHGKGMDAARTLRAAGGPLEVTPGAPGTGMPPGGMPPGAMPAMPAQLPTDVAQRIEVNRKLTQQNPKDRQAWVQLGNDYFDSQQPQKSIDAYTRALELDPNDPNVLTDQGVMYRATGQFDRAIENFEKANKVDPRHAQSLFNLGVVWANDKKDPAKATAAWKKVIQVAPQSPQAAQAQQALAELQAAPR
jgi:cytochrome c-type biogenesis protein CcmH/NrfG